MKRYVTLLCSFLIILGVAGTAWAIPTTWTDYIDFSPDIKIPPSYSYVHDITDGANAFDGIFMGDGGDDIIYSYVLSVELYDDGGRRDGGEIAYIDQPGFVGDSILYNFSYVSTYGWSIAGVLELNKTGNLGVTVSSWYGDFYLASSTLVAYGDNGSGSGMPPVPEPATIILLSVGLLGMAGLGRKRLGN